MAEKSPDRRQKVIEKYHIRIRDGLKAVARAFVKGEAEKMERPFAETGASKCPDVVGVAFAGNEISKIRLWHYIKWVVRQAARVMLPFSFSLLRKLRYGCLI
ncbi:MAG: hypothetical protein LBC78_04470 [Oscillospiraceae bacterium]|nr:hypothetical protein [Oscillospiraceae bacterium]